MSLKTAVAVPFRQRGTDRLREGEFTVALSLELGWFSPDQAERLVDVAAGRGLLDRDGEELVATFDPGSVTVPESFTPDESVLRTASTFERVLDALVAAGHDKQEAVAAINRRQRELGVTVEAAAVLHARRQGLDVDAEAEAALRDLDG